MAGVVYFAELRARAESEGKAAKVRRLFDAAGFPALVGKGDPAAIKLHFGEPGSDCFIKPMYVRSVADRLKELGAKPFLTDTNTMYSGGRSNAVDHAWIAAAHGFSLVSTGAPVIIAGGLKGENSTRVPIEGKHFSSALIASEIAAAGCMIVMSHFKGHILAGFGGAIKNMAMGCAPPQGKREQHTPGFFVKEEACVLCGLCAEVCPESAVTLGPEAASIDRSVCAGCGECYARCPHGAIDIDWSVDIAPFMERMTEYALGAARAVQGRVGYINFLLDITPDCDCLPWSDAPIVPDIGILAASDPVALDRACFDLVNREQGLGGTKMTCNHAPGEDKFKGVWGRTRGEIQFEHGARIGLGTPDYELVTI